MPLDQFRRRSKGSDKPHADCRECHRMDQGRRRAEKAGREFRRLTSDVHRYRGSSIDRIAVFVGAAIDSFGGLDRIVRAWKGNLHRTIKQGDWKEADRQAAMIMELLTAMTRERHWIDQETLSHATADEIQAEQWREFWQMLVDLGETDEDASRMVERIRARASSGAPAC
jgi:hypothetical protein